MRHKLFISLFALGMIAACTNMPDTETEPTQNTEYEHVQIADKVATDAERAECLARGGEVRRAGMGGWENCIQQLSDGGKTCSDSSDCIGDCLIVGAHPGIGVKTTGQCRPDDSPFGCFSRVTDGYAEPTLCVD